MDTLGHSISAPQEQPSCWRETSSKQQWKNYGRKEPSGCLGSQQRIQQPSRRWEGAGPPCRRAPGFAGAPAAPHVLLCLIRASFSKALCFLSRVRSRPPRFPSHPCLHAPAAAIRAGAQALQVPRLGETFAFSLAQVQHSEFFQARPIKTSWKLLSEAVSARICLHSPSEKSRGPTFCNSLPLCTVWVLLFFFFFPFSFFFSLFFLRWNNLCPLQRGSKRWVAELGNAASF